MLIDGFLTDTERSSGSSLYTYCRLEGLDYRHMVSEAQKKSGRKEAASGRKKLMARKFLFP